MNLELVYFACVWVRIYKDDSSRVVKRVLILSASFFKRLVSLVLAFFGRFDVRPRMSSILSKEIKGIHVMFI